MKKTKLLGYLVALSIAVVSCSGEDGDPGPQGATGATGEQGAAGEGFEKVGYFQGTVSGNRTDGTAFSETFKYEYGSSVLGFEDNFIDISRNNKASYTDGYFNANNLLLSGGTLGADPNFSSLFFRFSKELNATDLFLVYARPYFHDLESYVLQISADHNETYKFSPNSNGTISFNTTFYDGMNVYAVYSYNDGFSYTLYFSEADGTLQAIFANGDYITSGTFFDLYDQLLFIYNADVGQPTFFDKATDASLHAVIPDVPADQFTVTNYTHDVSTGVMSFDFVLKISQYRPRTGYSYGFNTSGNDLTITGSFSSGVKTYSNVVGRTASGG
jgi:hypothetical protein